MITGQSHTINCVVANSIKSKLNELIYGSMINSLVPSVKSSTYDMTEMIRLARLLWPEYVSPLRTNDLQSVQLQIVDCLKRDTTTAVKQCSNRACPFCTQSATTDRGGDLTSLKNSLFEKLDRNVRESMRSLLSNAVLMPGRSIARHPDTPYAERLPHTTKFLLLAAFLCQNKRPEKDVNLFTTNNTGKSKRGSKTDEGAAYAFSSSDLRQLRSVRQPSFPLERMLSVFYSIISQYGTTGETTTVVAELGTERLFRNIAQLISTELVRSVSSNTKIDVMDAMAEKFSCPLAREDASVIASSVGFPLDKYCP